MIKTKKDVMKWIDKHAPEFTGLSDEIWDHPEVSHKEFYSSKLQADYMAAQGFKVTWDVGGLQTAFVAEWGKGKPIIGFLGEFDALPGLSQMDKADPEPLVPGGPGHGCGHNLLGVGCMASVVALKEWMTANKVKGTLRYYGCPAEESYYGKTFMARAGAFDDLDVAFNYHPSEFNAASKAEMVGVYDLKFRFHGRSAHAGGAPHLGRSALDAVELMNVGVNYLREHVTSNVRMHYATTNGGAAPNIVPAEAEVWYFIRALSAEERLEVLNRVRKVAQGAAMMTETTVEEIFRSACSATLNNKYLADLQYENLKLVGPISYTDEELAYAAQINAHYKAIDVEDRLQGFKADALTMKKLRANLLKPLNGEIYPSIDEGNVETGSTDVGDVSQITPLSMLGSACFSTNASGHSWGIVASSRASFGHKGMLLAAKVMALSAMDCFTDPAHIRKARDEFKQATGGKPYMCPLPDHVKPPRFPAAENWRNNG